MKEPDSTKLLEAAYKFAAMVGEDMGKLAVIVEGMFEGMNDEDYASKGEEVLLRNANKNNIKPGMRDGIPLKRKKGRR